MDEIAGALDRTARAIDRAIARELKRNDIELDPVMARLLHGIGNRRITTADLTVRGYMTGSNAVYVRSQLRNRGYLKPCKKGGSRRQVLELTEKGQQVALIVSHLFVIQETQAKLIGLRPPDCLAILQRLERFFVNLVV